MLQDYSEDEADLLETYLEERGDGDTAETGPEKAKETKETKKRKAPSKPRQPVAKLDADRLFSSNGFRYIRKYAAGLSFKSNEPGKNLGDLLDFYKEWAHTLFPKVNFADFVQRVERQTHQRLFKIYWSRLLMAMQRGEDLNEADFVLRNYGQPRKEREEDETEETERQSLEAVSKPVVSEETKAQIERNRESALRRLAEHQKEKQKEREQQQQQHQVHGNAENELALIFGQDEAQLQTTETAEGLEFIDEECVE